MKIGTKSLLFGCHQFLLHPYYTFKGWVALYGWDSKGYSWWKLIICFIIHDWGYWGCKDMDGEEGEKHPIKMAEWVRCHIDTEKEWNRYALLVKFHSRFLAKKNLESPSPLCWADKVGTALMPSWLWVFLGRLTGELDEYMTAMKRKESGMTATDPVEYHKEYREVIAGLLFENGIPEKEAWAFINLGSLYSHPYYNNKSLNAILKTLKPYRKRGGLK